MKRWQLVAMNVLAIAIFSGMIPTLAWSQGRGQGFRPCPYTPYLCPVTHVCESFAGSGKVVQVVTETLEGNMQPGMAIVVDTKTHGRVHVHLGPVWYLERQEFDIKPGDEVEIKGMSDKKNEKLDLIAYELVHGDHVLHLRDSQGRPNWEAWRKR